MKPYIAVMCESDVSRARVLEFMLIKCNFVVHWATDAPQAVELARRLGPAVVLGDAECLDRVRAEGVPTACQLVIGREEGPADLMARFAELSP